MNSQLQTEFQDRTVTLSDGRPGLRGGIHVDVQEPVVAPGPTLDSGLRTLDSSAAILDFVASDETLDRYDEVIAASGWKLENYQRNPVFQNAHKYGDIIFTLGKALITEIREVGRVSPSAPPRHVLYQRIQFATDVNPMAKIAYGLYKGKFLNAVSVGFIPLKWENGTPPSGGSPGTTYRRKYIEQELLEVSAVGIPANPNALQLGLKAGAIEKGDLRDLSDLIRHALDQPNAGEVLPPPGGEGQGEGERTSTQNKSHGKGQGEGGISFSRSRTSHSSHHSQLLRIARDLRNLLKHT